MPRSFRCPFEVPFQKYVWIFCFSSIRYMSITSYPPCFDHPNYSVFVKEYELWCCCAYWCAIISLSSPVIYTSFVSNYCNWNFQCLGLFAVFRYTEIQCCIITTIMRRYHRFFWTRVTLHSSSWLLIHILCMMQIDSSWSENLKSKFHRYIGYVLCDGFFIDLLLGYLSV